MVGQRKVSGKYLDNLENRSICVHIIITFLFETTATPKLSSSISKQTIQRKRSDLEAYWPFRSKKNAGGDGLVKWQSLLNKICAKYIPLSLKFVSLRSDEQRDSQIQDKLHFQSCKLGDFGFQPVQEIIQN